MANDNLLSILAGIGEGASNVLVPWMQANHQAKLAQQNAKYSSDVGFEDFRRRLPMEEESKQRLSKVNVSPDVSNDLGIPAGPMDKEFLPGYFNKTRSSNSGKVPITKSQAIKMAKMGQLLPPNVEIIDDTEKPPKDPNQNEYLSAGYANRMEQANKIFDKLEKDVVGMGSAKQYLDRAQPNISPFKSNTIKSQEQAERNFLNAVLRRESGAVISPSEFEEGRKQYFPQPGDTEDVLNQKRQNRQTAINSFIRAGGNAYSPSADLPLDSGNQIPSIGQTFNGSKVLKVTRVQ